MIFSPKQLANQLKLIRNTNNWTQAEVAKKVGVKQATISSFENNPDRCQLHTLFKLLQALQVSMQISPTQTSNNTVAISDDENW